MTLTNQQAVRLVTYGNDAAVCAEDLEAVLTQLHEMKHELEGTAREDLLVAIDKVQAAWAACTEARSALRYVTQ